MYDRYGRPIKEKHPMTRDLITYFTESFEATRNADDQNAAIQSLLDELCIHKSVNSYIHIVENDGYYGVRHELLGIMLLPAIYDELTPIGFNDELIYIARRSGKYGIVNADVIGTELLPFTYDRIARMEEILDLFVFEQGGHQGIIGKHYGQFTELLPAIYDNISQYPDTPFVLLTKEEKVGLWGTTLPIAPKYDEISVPYFFGWIKVKHQGTWGYIDCDGHFTDDVSKAFLYHDADRYYYFPELEEILKNKGNNNL